MGVELVFFMVEAQSNWSWSPSRAPGAALVKINAQDACGLRFWQSTYAWKANLITYPIALVSHQNPFWINGNRQNKSASRICQDAATPSIGPLDHVSCLGPLGGACNRTVQIIIAQV
jgi:hypothetical protein